MPLKSIVFIQTLQKLVLLLNSIIKTPKNPWGKSAPPPNTIRVKYDVASKVMLYTKCASLYWENKCQIREMAKFPPLVWFLIEEPYLEVVSGIFPSSIIVNI